MSLDRAATPDVLEALHAGGLLPAPAFERALALSCASPGVQRWRKFLDWLLLGLGASLLLVGLVLFVAFNWSALHAFVKLGLIASLIAGAAYAAWWFELSSVIGRVALTAAAVLIGPLLAIYGQRYQTGADPWQLFVAWAALAALWAGISRFPPLLLVELVLIDAAVWLFWDQVVPTTSWGRDDELIILLILAGLQGAAWAAWELGAWRKLDWLQARWLPRVLAVATLCLLGGSCARLVVGEHYGSTPVEAWVGLVGLVGSIAAMLVVFTQLQRDLFMIAAALAATMTLATIFIGRVLFEGPGGLGAVFVLGLLVIGEVGAAAWWLRRLHRQWETAR